MDRRNKAREVRAAYRQLIKKEEDDFKKEHIFPIQGRSTSCHLFSGKYQRATILGEDDMFDAHKFFLHPTRRYKKFVRDHAANDFAEIRAQTGDDEVQYRYLRR